MMYERVYRNGKYTESLILNGKTGPVARLGIRHVKLAVRIEIPGEQLQVVVALDKDEIRSTKS